MIYCSIVDVLPSAGICILNVFRGISWVRIAPQWLLQKILEPTVNRHLHNNSKSTQNCIQKNNLGSTKLYKKDPKRLRNNQHQPTDGRSFICFKDRNGSGGMHLMQAVEAAQAAWRGNGEVPRRQVQLRVSGKAEKLQKISLPNCKGNKLPLVWWSAPFHYRAVEGSVPFLKVSGTYSIHHLFEIWRECVSWKNQRWKVMSWNLDVYGMRYGIPGAANDIFSYVFTFTVSDDFVLGHQAAAQHGPTTASIYGHARLPTATKSDRVLGKDGGSLWSLWEISE